MKVKLLELDVLSKLLKNVGQWAAFILNNTFENYCGISSKHIYFLKVRPRMTLICFYSLRLLMPLPEALREHSP